MSLAIARPARLSRFVGRSWLADRLDEGRRARRFIGLATAGVAAVSGFVPLMSLVRMAAYPIDLDRSTYAVAVAATRRKRHDGQVGALRRRCHVAAVDGHDHLYPDAIGRGRGATRDGAESRRCR